MTKLLASTALIAMLAAPVMAQTATDSTTAPATTEAPAAGGTPATTGAASDMSADTTAAPMTTDAAATTEGFGYTAMAGDKSAETFIGKRLYVSETDVDANMQITEADKGWDDIGEISDLVLGEDGRVKAVLVDIGGFLGMGEKSVAVSMNELRVIRDGNSENDYFIVFTAGRAALESTPAFEWPKM